MAGVNQSADTNPWMRFHRTRHSGPASSTLCSRSVCLHTSLHSIKPPQSVTARVYRYLYITLVAVFVRLAISPWYFSLKTTAYWHSRLARVDDLMSLWGGLR